MKKVLIFLLCICLTFSFFGCKKQEDNVGQGVLNIYNWGQYLSLGEEDYIDVLEEFTKETGIKVNYNVYDSNESMYAKLETGGTSIDLVIPSDYMVERLIKNDMLLKLDFNNIPNFKYVDKEFKNLNFDPTNEYSVPYTYGTVGIIYNKKYVSEPVDSWNVLWDKKYKDKTLMFDNSRDAFGVAQTLLGYDVNNCTKEQYNKCFEKLVEQKPVVQQYVMDQIFETMVSEEAWIAPYYAGDYLIMLEDNENLAFAHPKEGFNYFVDAFCIPKGAKNKKEAEAFINFLCKPEISGKNMDYVGYSSPISASKEFMSPDMANSEIVYPSKEKLEKAYMFKNVSDEILQHVNNLWLKVKIS